MDNNKELNGKPVDLLNSLEMFAETMEERYNGYNNSLLAIASNGDQSLLSSFGSNEAIIDALSTILYQNSEFFAIVQIALSLAIAAKYKNDSIVNDAE